MRAGARGGGFTLIELVIALAVLSVLLTVATPIIRVQVQRQQESELRAALREIRNAIDSYKRASDDGRIVKSVGESGYPPNLEVLVAGVPDSRDPARRPMYFLRRIPRDPFAPAAVDPNPGWGLRSYASPPDAPSAGNDVFDVYSRSDRVGLNGTPYRMW